MSGAAANPNSGVALKVRLSYSKLGKVRFTSHRDMARIWERSLRRAGLPVAYSQGFSPRAKFSFGLALPTTFESATEYVDLSFSHDEVDVAALPGLLTPLLPVGVEAIDAQVLRGDAVSLQQVVTSTTWLLQVAATHQVVADWVTRVVEQPEIMITRERKGKSTTDDIRPAILSLTLADADDSGDSESDVVGIIAELATQPRALRPNELLSVLEPEFTFRRGRRLHQWTASSGARVDPMSAGAAETPRSEVCAS